MPFSKVSSFNSHWKFVLIELLSFSNANSIIVLIRLLSFFKVNRFILLSVTFISKKTTKYIQ